MTAEVGSIVGYLALDRSNWDQELAAAGRKADELSRHDPNIKIKTNAPSAITQLAAVAAATKKLQDAQGTERLALGRLSALQASAKATEGQLAAAEERLAKARRSTAAATIALAAVHDRNDAAMRRATADTDKMAASTDKATFKAHLLADAIALVGPAAIPVAAVAGGALLGLVPVAATVALAVAGIKKQMMAGAQQGTQFAHNVAALSGELTHLETIAASGIMAGVNRALQSSGPLFGALNTLVGQTSARLGDIVGGAAPALVAVLTQLDPLFATLGSVVSDGAKALEHWATAGGGFTSFVAYVQAELPTVEHALSMVVVSVAHLVAGLAPLGHVALTTIGVLASAIAAIPVPILGKLETAAIAAYLAFRTYSGITAIVNKVSGAIESFQTKQAASAAVAQAASLRTQAAAADEAAAVAAAKAAEATAAAESATEQAAAAERAGAADAALTQIIAENAIEQAAMFQAAADAAAASAAEIAASADAASASVDEAGAAASVGWSGLLGPLAAVGVGVALLTSVFASNNQQAQENQKIMDSYAQSLQQSSNALAEVNIQATAKNLKDQGAIDLANKLKASNTGVTLGYGQLALAVNGSKKQFDAIYNSLIQVAKANVIYSRTGAIYNDTGKAANDLADKITNLRDNFTKEMKVQQELSQVQRQANILADGGSTAAAHQARTLGLSTTAYLDAQTAAQKNTAQTKAQTAAFQAENDAASLLNQALQALAGINLTVAQNETALRSANLQVKQSFKDNGAAIRGSSAAAVANQQAVQGNITAAQQLAAAIGKKTHSTRAEIASLKDSKAQLEDQLRAQGKLTPAVQAYIDRLYNLKGVSDYLTKHPTKLDANSAAARAVIADLTDRFHALEKSNPTVHVYADTKHATANIDQLVRGIDHRVAYVQVSTVGGAPSGGRAFLGAPNSPGHNAAGTMNWRGGLTYLAENGPELVQLPRGSKVYPNNSPQTQAALHGNDQRPVNVTVNAPQTIDPDAVGWAAGRHVAAALGL